MTVKNFVTAGLCALGLGSPLMAETAPFASGWSLDAESSTLNFLSVKKGNVMELSGFASLDGRIDEAGQVQLEIPLDSVDTGIDLRNVRMRFLLFEAFNYPQATVRATLTADMLHDLEALGTKTMTMPVTLDLHGVQQVIDTEMLVTLIGKDRVAISSVKPAILSIDAFGLTPGLEKLEETAGVDITPFTAVTYNFAFDRNAATVAPAETAIDLATVALEPEGAFSDEACVGRFEILSRSGNISFGSNSADLLRESEALLNNVADIARRCSGMIIQVAGHTDSVGSAEYNLFLSQQRAASVVSYLVNAGLSSDQFVDRGFGETQPIASNATSSGRQENRRIEFSVVDFQN